MKTKRDERGQVLISTVLCMMILLGFMAFATDVGMLFYHKRTMQSAADAAALAGALEVAFASTDGTTVTAVAQGAATQNGYTNGTNGVTVTVNNPPLSGPHTSGGTAANYVEVIVKQPVPTVFMGLFRLTPIDITARAVAGSTVNPGCVWTLGTTGPDISMTGSGSLTIPNCDIYDDSSSAGAVTMTGSGNIQTTQLGIVAKNGAVLNTGSGEIENKSGGRLTPQTGIAAVPDPLANVQAPTANTAGCQGAQNFAAGNHTLNATCYASVNATAANVTFGPGDHTINGNLTTTGGSISFGAGTYFINGDFTVTSSLSITGSNVSFYVTGSTSITGSPTITLSAPTSGAQNGILFFQARNDTQPMTFTGSGTTNIQGIIYAPASDLTMTGGGVTNISTDLIVSSVTFTGSTPFQSYANINSNSPLSKSSLVE